MRSICGDTASVSRASACNSKIIGGATDTIHQEVYVIGSVIREMQLKWIVIYNVNIGNLC